MRLLDQVAHATGTMFIEDPRGVHAMPGAGALAAVITNCRLRYVLDARVVARCRALLTTDRAMLTPENDLLRAPAPNLWLEWQEDGSKAGLLVDADEAGRAGVIRTVWEQRGAEPIIAQAALEWTFDRPVCRTLDDDTLFHIDAHRHPLADHLRFRIAPSWLDHLFAEDQPQGVARVTRICRTVLRDAEMLFAFSALLLHRPEIATAPASLDRLNAQRRKAGKRALLDHLAVTLDLDRCGSGGGGSAAGASRTARLHLVRGHMVHRQSRSFWRRSHLRGSLHTEVASRTTLVR